MEDSDYLPATQMLESTQVLSGDQDVTDSADVKFGVLKIGDTSYDITGGETKIGRDPLCKIWIKNPSLSRIHAVIDADQDGVTIHDNKSSNGTKKGGMSMKAQVRYNLDNGDKIKIGNIFATFEAVSNEAKDESDVESNASDTLLDDFDGENVPPNFVPETPVLTKPPISKGRPSLGDLSFIPETQSSPLPTSSVANRMHLFKVPESPCSDLNDSSFIAASQQPTVMGHIGMSSRRQQTNSSSAVTDSDPEIQVVEETIEETTTETTTETTDILDADTEQLAAQLQRVDTNKLDSLFSSAKMLGDSLVLEAETADMSLISGQTSLLEAETQAVTGSPTDSCWMSLTNSRSNIKIRNKMTDTQILGASTQTLLANLSESEVMVDTPRMMTDSLTLATSTQVLGQDVTAGEGEDSNDSLILASTQPVFKMPGQSRTSMSDITPSPAETDLVPCTTATVPSTDDILVEEVTHLEDSEHEDEEDTPEDQTQADMNFEDIQESLKAAEEVLAESLHTKSPVVAVFVSESPTVDFANEDSNCSEDLLDGSREKDLIDATLKVEQEPEKQINASECFSKTSVENLTMEVATQPSTLASQQLSATSVEDVSMEVATQPSTVASQHLSATSVEDVSMVEASQPAPSISRTATLGRDKTNMNSVTMDQTTAVDSEIISCHNLENVVTASDVSDPSMLGTSEYKEESEEITESKVRPISPANNTSEDKSLCLQLESTLPSPGESPVFKKSQSLVENTSQLEETETKTNGEDEELDNIDTHVGVKGILPIRAIRRKSSISSSLNTSVSRSEESKSPEPDNPPSQPSTADSEDSEPMLPCTYDLIADADGSSEEDDDDIPCTPMKKSQEVGQDAETDIELDGELTVKESGEDPADQNPSDNQASPNQPQEEKNSTPNLDTEMDPKKDPSLGPDKGKILEKASGSNKKEPGSKLKRNKRASVAPSRPSETVASSDAKPDGKKKLSLPAGILDSPATISSPRAIPSPLNLNSSPPKPLLAKEQSKTSRKTRAKKELSEDWIVNKKPKSKGPDKTKLSEGVDVSVTAADLAKNKTKSKVLEAQLDPSPASLGANVSVTAAEAIKARKMRSAQKNDFTISEQAVELAPTLPPRKSRGRKKETTKETIVSKTDESSSKTLRGVRNRVSTGENVWNERESSLGRESSSKKRVSFEAEPSENGSDSGTMEPEPTKTTRRKFLLCSRKKGQSSVLETLSPKPDEDCSEPVVRKGRGKTKKSMTPGNQETPKNVVEEAQNNLKENSEECVKGKRGRSKKVITSVGAAANVENTRTERVDEKNETIVKRGRGRPNKSDSLEGPKSGAKVVDIPGKTEKKKPVDNQKKSGRSRTRMSEIPKVKTPPEEDPKPPRGRRRKTEPVPNLSEEPITAEVVIKTSRRSRRNSLTKEDSVSSVSTLPAINEENMTTDVKQGRKRKAEVTPERASSSGKRRPGERPASGSGGTRSRSGQSVSSEGCSSPSLRKVESLNRSKFAVMFTGYNEQGDVTTVRQLQGAVTESVAECTVLVTDKIRRTAKFLSMVARGVPIVSPAWISDSKKHARFLNPWDYILNDPPNEKKWAFKLSNTLEKAKTVQLLKGLSIHVTEHVQPSPEMCRDIVECGGGQFLVDLPSTADKHAVIISCPEDKKITQALEKSGLAVMDKEWLLTGLLKYKLDKKLKVS